MSATCPTSLLLLAAQFPEFATLVSVPNTPSEKRKPGRPRTRPAKDGYYTLATAPRGPGRPRGSRKYPSGSIRWWRERLQSIADAYAGLTESDRVVLRRTSTRLFPTTIGKELQISTTEVRRRQMELAKKFAPGADQGISGRTEGVRLEYLQWFAQRLEEARWKITDEILVLALGVSVALEIGWSLKRATSEMSGRSSADQMRLSRSRRGK